MNIKCSKFCPYNKKLFCPFYKEVEIFEQTDFEKDIIPSKIKTKKQSIKPSPMKAIFKSNNGGSGGENDDDDNNEIQWMRFSGEISYRYQEVDFLYSFSGKMEDLKFGTFDISNSFLDDNGNTITQSGNGAISTGSKESDFGGEIDFNIEKTKFNGKFELNYEGGGMPIENEEGEETGEISPKKYSGKAILNNIEATINIYTDM